MAKLPLAISRRSGWRTTMANDQNGNDGNRADNGATRVDSQWGGMKNITELSTTGEGSGAEALLIGAFTEKGQDLICQPWDNSNTLYTIVYQWDDTDQAMRPVIPHGNNTGQGTGGKRWVVGDFDGTKKDKICQVRTDDTGAIQLVVYTLMNQEMVVLGNPAHTGTSYMADDDSCSCPWLVGNICHARAEKQNICQVWHLGYDDNFRVGFTIYEWDENINDPSKSVMVSIWSKTINWNCQGAAWLIGDINGDGLDEIVQVFDDDDVSMAVYGWVKHDDSGYMNMLWKGDLPEQSADALPFRALAWLIGDVDGDGKPEIIQMYGDDKPLTSIVYAWRDGGMVEIGKNTNLREVSSPLSWQVGDFNGDGKIEVCQLWENDHGKVGMTVYGWDDSDSQLKEIWYGYNLGVTADFKSFLVGNVTAGPGDNICQLIDNNGGLDIVVYGSTPS
jgi:hypothetical protein